MQEYLLIWQHMILALICINIKEYHIIKFKRWNIDKLLVSSGKEQNVSLFSFFLHYDY